MAETHVMTQTQRNKQNNKIILSTVHYGYCEIRELPCFVSTIKL